MAVEIVGKASTAKWYVFEDGVFSIHTALVDGEELMFRSDNKTWPSMHMDGLEYQLIRNATDEEAEKFIAMEGLVVKQVVEIA